MTDEGFRLRELETPVKIYFTQSQSGTTLTYRKQLYKTSGSVSGIIAGGTFEEEEILTLDQSTAERLTAFNDDFFSRLYTYNTPAASEDIPPMVLSVMKQDVLEMNDIWHGLKLKHLAVISDDMNIAIDKLFFAPTSTNTKYEYTWTETINGVAVVMVLQKSQIRTEVGGQVSTYAIEVKLPKVTKKNLPSVLDTWLGQLVNMGLVPTDAQGTSPSPSKLTERILQEIF
jgi:hypothetical protein